MKTILKLLPGVFAVFAVGLCACSSDEPTPTPEPDTPEMPIHPDKDWNGEHPHGFLIDATLLTLPISERGFLICNGSDEIIIDSSKKPDDGLMHSPSARYNDNTSWYNATSIWFDGIIADPFENVDKYIETCQRLGFRPKSQFSEFESLMSLPAPDMWCYFSTEDITSVDIITENYFDKEHPAGSSMKKANPLPSAVGASIHVMPGSMYFPYWAEGKLYSIQGPGWILQLGEKYSKEKGGCPADAITLTFFGFPEKAGEYPMVLKITMNGGEKVLERPFTIKYVDKK